MKQIPCWFKDIIIIITKEMKLIFSGQRDFFKNVVPNKDMNSFLYKPVFSHKNAQYSNVLFNVNSSHYLVVFGQHCTAQLTFNIGFRHYILYFFTNDRNEIKTFMLKSGKKGLFRDSQPFSVEFTCFVQSQKYFLRGSSSVNTFIRTTLHSTI